MIGLEANPAPELSTVVSYSILQGSRGVRIGSIKEAILRLFEVERIESTEKLAQ